MVTVVHFLEEAKPWNPKKQDKLSHDNFNGKPTTISHTPYHTLPNLNAAWQHEKDWKIYLFTVGKMQNNSQYHLHMEEQKMPCQFLNFCVICTCWLTGARTLTRTPENNRPQDAKITPVNNSTQTIQQPWTNQHHNNEKKHTDSIKHEQTHTHTPKPLTGRGTYFVVFADSASFDWSDTEKHDRKHLWHTFMW